MANSKRSFDAVVSRFEAERSALLEGRLDDVPGLVAQRQADIDVWMASNGVTREQAAKIKSLAQRNAGLLDAARQGIADGGAKLDAIRQAQTRLGTYDASGQIGETATIIPRHEKRA